MTLFPAFEMLHLNGPVCSNMHRTRIGPLMVVPLQFSGAKVPMAALRRRPGRVAVGGLRPAGSDGDLHTDSPANAHGHVRGSSRADADFGAAPFSSNPHADIRADGNPSSQPHPHAESDAYRNFHPHLYADVDAHTDTDPNSIADTSVCSHSVTPLRALGPVE